MYKSKNICVARSKDVSRTVDPRSFSRPSAQKVFAKEITNDG